jgi:FMN phosphatase YigB (HAD superfamily)
MKPVKALFFDLDETLLDGSGLQESIVQTCKVIAASKSGLEEWRRTLRMCGRNDESLADFAVRTLRGWRRSSV